MRGQAAGFSLVEVLIGMTLFSVLMLALSQNLLAVPQINVRTSDVQQVTLAAKSYFEEVGTALAANFGGPLPAAPSVGGQVCTGTPTDLLSDSGGVAVRRVTLNCTLHARPYTFAQDFGRQP